MTIWAKLTLQSIKSSFKVNIPEPKFSFHWIPLVKIMSLCELVNTPFESQNFTQRCWFCLLHWSTCLLCGDQSPLKNSLNSFYHIAERKQTTKLPYHKDVYTWTFHLTIGAHLVGWVVPSILSCFSCSVTLCVELVFPVQHCDFLTGHEGVFAKAPSVVEHCILATSQAAFCTASTPATCQTWCREQLALTVWGFNTVPPCDYVLVQLMPCHPWALLSHSISQLW